MIFDKALAFTYMGLHNKAVPEFARRIKEDYAVEKIVPELTDSMLKLNSPANALIHLGQLLIDKKIGIQNSAQIRFFFGREMEKRDQRELALDIYIAAHKIDPANLEIKNSLDSITASFTSGCRSQIFRPY